MYINSKQRKRERIFLIITIGMIVCSLLFSFFRFSAVFGRMLEAVKDCLLSVVHYALFLFELETLVHPTIGILPENIETILPLTIAQFKKLMGVYGELLFDESNFTMFINMVGNKIADVSLLIMQLLLPVLCLCWIMFLLYRDVDNDRGQDSKPLQIFKCFESKTFTPMGRSVRKFCRWFSRQKWLRRALVCIWLYNLNAFTIVMETLAWLLYFCLTFDINATFIWLAKVGADLTVSIFFLPAWVWAVLGVYIFNVWRNHVGFKRIEKGIEQNKKFLIEHPGAKFVTGKQRSNKTSLITQWKKIIEEKIFRPKAKEKLSVRDKQFPDFCWAEYEHFLKNARKAHKLHTNASVREFITFLRWADTRDKTLSGSQRRTVRRYLKRRWGYNFEGYCFGYKPKGVFNDGLQLHTIYDALENYGKAFYIYNHGTPLDISNYPIRSDFEIEDKGNFPEFKSNLGKNISTQESMKATKYGHRMNWDVFRLGEQFDPNNDENNAVEYGIGVSMEHAKERKNQITKRSVEKKVGEPNQDNDFHELDVKIRGHVATVDFFNFWDWLFDDQRAGSLGSDNRNLTTNVQIKKSGKEKSYKPFFALEEALYLTATAIYDKLYYFIRKNKGKNTLLVYLMQKLYIPLFSFYIRNFNVFCYRNMELKVVDGSDDQTLNEALKLPLIYYVAYRFCFTTDGLGDFYYAKVKKSSKSLNDIPQYKSIRMSFAEMMQQNSYMIKDMTKAFDGQWKDKTQEKSDGVNNAA